VPQADIERTLNQGIGFVAVLAEAQAERAIELSRAGGIPAWRLGDITTLERAEIEAGTEVVRGAKGVDGGSVQVVGQHPTT
jgi:phosphoribosylformylglycinamidine cyclo-ligase